MHLLLPRSLSPACVVAGTVFCFVAFVRPALAQDAGSRGAVDCARTSTRIEGMRHVPADASLHDLSIAIADGQDGTLGLSDLTLLEGPCARGAYAFRMAQLFFEDSAVYTAGAGERFIYMPALKGLTNFGGEPLSRNHPVIEQAEFIMASNVEVAGKGEDSSSLDVGLWKTTQGYLVAAFIRRHGSYGKPIELLTSVRPIKSVTYFPSPDSPSGKLGLMQVDGADMALVSLAWNHGALSRNLISGN